MLNKNKINKDKNKTYKLKNKDQSKLEKLFENYKDNLHQIKEIDWGKPVGKEFW